ncbi:MAG: nucleoside triphosphate pyrophosphatase [Acidimicrobiales bacterium]
MAEAQTAPQRHPLVLASASPRRRVLLAMIRVGVDVVPADIDEAALTDGLDPTATVTTAAHAKAEAVDGQGRPVLAADTVVVLDGGILGKPADRADAADMLLRQSGRTAEVISCVVLKHTDGSVTNRTAHSTLAIAKLDDSTIAEYLATGEADDKAGALAVQGAAKPFVTIVDGSRSNVFGLPLAETIELLRGAGIAVEEPRP